jgi:hypothetical protein
MQPQPAPRHFVASPALPGAGLPHDRMARLAARQAFVQLKQVFNEALVLLDEPRAGWLREQVRRAEEPVDLWLLRSPILAALAGADPQRRHLRRRLRAGLDAVFLDSGPPSGFSPF